MSDYKVYTQMSDIDTRRSHIILTFDEYWMEFRCHFVSNGTSLTAWLRTAKASSAWVAKFEKKYVKRIGCPHVTFTKPHTLVSRMTQCRNTHTHLFLG